jgi:NAD(P)-dependent dehydrogenase (short-subunit alcohol dehydrogenase family)
MKTVIITGASRGIGAATAILAAKHYRVCVNYCHSPDRAEQVVREIVDAGGEAFACRADMAVEGDIVSLFDQVEQRWSRVDALVNNAGVLDKQCAVADLTVRRLERLFRVNAIGVFVCCREAARRMSEGGAIVNVSSVASRLGAAGEYVDYAATKGALDSLTIGLSKELAPRKIRVNAVRPGFIKTEIHADGGEAERPDRVAPNLPLRRAGESAEVARAILWLLSDEASYVTGSFLEMGGGV